VAGDQRVNGEGPIPIRSYRLCFELERRIHKIDRWRIPVPYGLPLRGVAYAVAALLAVLALARLPLLGELIGALHPALRFVVVPCAAAVWLVRLRIDGRVAHAHLAAAARQRAAPAYIAGFRPVPPPGPVRLGDVELAPDGSDARLRPARIDGPCRLLLRYPASARRRGRTLRLAPVAGEALWRGKAIAVPEGRRVVVGR
jgi:hypothetical protein